ncbi:hypothetical protein BRADI_1g29424v3 [Brachypodium distachyon]|uniref:Uncharacterized protein n=1 Tax=Brachypodium distachyon TaxID=15368 RepID=A0A0Q3H1V3_BRADI|nr:hypothetical protein BRADI_1g29424v3 [Brachypodium distachyon]
MFQLMNIVFVYRRLSGVMELLSSKQPNCPQLYIYSSADRVIPAKSVESFVERQPRAGCEVRSCDLSHRPMWTITGAIQGSIPLS